MLTFIYSESAYPITSVEPLKPPERFWDDSEICLLLVVNNNNIIFGICVLD